MSPAAAQDGGPPEKLLNSSSAAAGAPPPKPPRRGACFSFAAYAKTLIDQLRSCGVQVAHGLSDAELDAAESSHGFRFPPDLRSILQEGLPVGPGFPDWRSASRQQLQILLALPASTIVAAVSKGAFWCAAWGPRPHRLPDAAAAAKNALSAAPPLVPVYRSYYIPAAPNLAGNPVLYVRGADVRCAGLDLADFFGRQDFGTPSGSPSPRAPAPAWAAKSARTVEVWTDVAEQGLRGGFVWTTTGWRESDNVGKCLEDVGWKLRDGGWKEADVREMLLMGEDQGRPPLTFASGDSAVAGLRDPQSVAWHVRLLGLALLRGGWSVQDVAYCVGINSTSTARAGADNNKAKDEQDRQLLHLDKPPRFGGNHISIDL